MSQPKVSIIVPIHNAGEYLEKCLFSLVNQTLKEIEIILILDCPTDGSDKIAEKYAASDNRVKLIYNETNLHTGYSRNKGMEIATGEYIGFHDHDDYSFPYMYEKLYKEAVSNNLEVVRCNFNCVYDQKIEPYIYPKQTDQLQDKSWLYDYVSGNKISCVLWNHIYKTDFLKKNDIKFLDSKTVCSEDSVFFLDVYNKLEKVEVVEDYLYNHVFHSSNTGKNYYYRSINNRLAFFEEIYSRLKDNGVSDEKAISYLYSNVIRSFYTAVRQAFITLPFSKAREELKPLFNNRLFSSCLSYLFSKKSSGQLRKLKPTIILFSLVMRKLRTK